MTDPSCASQNKHRLQYQWRQNQKCKYHSILIIFSQTIVLKHLNKRNPFIFREVKKNQNKTQPEKMEEDLATPTQRYCCYFLLELALAKNGKLSPNWKVYIKRTASNWSWRYCIWHLFLWMHRQCASLLHSTVEIKARRVSSTTAIY